MEACAGLWITHAGLWITFSLTTICCFVTGQQNEDIFLEAITKLHLSNDNHFNAAIGARISIAPQSFALCEEGNHCIKSWWFSADTKNSPATTTLAIHPILFEQQSTMSATGPSLQSCDGFYITCNRTCPTTQFSTPRGELVMFDREDCANDKKGLIPAEEMVYPIHVTTGDDCIALNFINRFSRTAGYQFQISLDFKTMRQEDDNKFLLLEGKLVSAFPSSTTAPSEETTFFWAVNKKADNFQLALYEVNTNEFRETPRKLYTAEMSQSYSEVTLFMRHISHAPSSTCFYLDGVRVYCLDSSLSGSRFISFVSLNGRNNFGYKIVTANFTEVKVFELGQTDAVISEREIQELSNKTVSYNQPPECLCQDVDHPFMRRRDWKVFGDYISMYNRKCFADMGNEAGTTDRVNVMDHSIYQAFDGDVSTTWMSKTGANNSTISIKFPNMIKVKGLVLVMATLPESLTAYEANGSDIESIELSCNHTHNCIQWDLVIANTEITENGPPALTWLFNRSVDVEELSLQFEGLRDETLDFLLINEISIIATCDCESEAECIVDRSVMPDNADINHSCDCPPKVTGMRCDSCDSGYYTDKPGGKVHTPQLCMPCQCDTLGTCMVVNGTCLLDNDTNTCNRDGHCMCRYQNTGRRYDLSNPKCSVELLSLTPDYGPVSGGTQVTLTGKYLLGHSSVSFTNMGRTTTLHASFQSSAADGYEELVFSTPPRLNDADKSFSIGVIGTRQPDFTFTYKPDPVVEVVVSRNIVTKGGLNIYVWGEGFDSVSQPRLLTHLHCVIDRRLFATVVSQCEGNRTTLTCITPDITQHLLGPKCVITSRLRRRRRVETRISPTDYTGIYARFGFTFDGVQTYRFIENSTRIRILDDPVLNVFNNSVRLNPNDKRLTISGQFLSLCCNVSDYEVYIGDELCVIEWVREHHIRCELPQSWKRASIGTEYNITVILGGNTITSLGTVLKIDYNYGSIWDDQSFVLTIAIPCTVTFVLAMAISTVICCVYHRHFFHAQTTTKVSVRDFYRARHPSVLQHPSQSELNGSYALHPTQTHYIQGPQVDRDVTYVTGRGPDEYTLEELEAIDRSNGVIRQTSTNSYNNNGYYEIEI